MGEEIFRKKSLEKIKSPEALDNYIRVANPGVWLLLISVIILLAGACVWGIFGHVGSTVPASVYVENGEAICYIADENISLIQAGLTVKFAESKAVITDIGEKEQPGYVCTLTADTALTDGFYEGKVVIQSYTPLTFVLN